MLTEMKAIEENGTWYPPGHRAIGLKWIFKVKRDEHGNIVKHKARLVVKGYAQRREIDYDEVFAPVAQLDSVQLLIALAAHRGWEVHHMDVKLAFLNGDLQEEVYVQQPAGFVNADRSTKFSDSGRHFTGFNRRLGRGMQNLMILCCRLVLSGAHQNRLSIPGGKAVSC
jgi:hypothetical protein